MWVLEIKIFISRSQNSTFFHKDARAAPSTLNQSTGNNMFQYQTFHMTLTQCFFALLHPDSIKNGLMAPLRDWRLFCHWALCSASWLMGSPGGLSEVSLKNKVWESERGMCLQMCIGKWTWCTLQGFLKCSQKANLNRNNLDSHIEGIPGLQTSLSLKRPCEREPACLPYSFQLCMSPTERLIISN